MIIHIDTETDWRGGQQQAVYLIEGLIRAEENCVLICRKNSKLAEYAQNNNIPYKILPLKFEGDIFSAFAIARFAKKNQAKLIHCHNSHALSIGLLSRLFVNVPLVGSRRVDFDIRDNYLSKLKYSSSKLDALICISNNIRRVVAKGGVPENKLRVIRSAIDLSRVNSADRKHIVKNSLPPHSLLIGTVAAMTGHKDYPNLIKAASLVLKTHPEVLFIAVGDGKLHSEIRHLINNQKIADRFILTGYQENVYDYIKAFDIFVLASKLEGLGTSVLDALNCGKACVCTDAGGIPEMIKNRQNGLLVPKKDSYSLAQALKILIEDADLRHNLSLNAVESVKEFDISVNVAKHLELYNELINAVK
jgi:glycosyltransferase involved in cell wall biosynthesis